jgi:S1-C subfamily serine protease
VVGSDPHTDLAVVRVEDAPGYARPLPVAGTSPEPGTPVAALGTPLGLDGSITSGIVSGANRSMPTGGGFVLPDTVQTDAPINPGNSGGPLVAADTPEAVVVGVNRARQGDNIGFAVSPEIVERVVPALATDGEYRHPYLRIRTLDVTPVVAEANGLDETRGSLVVDVPLGPASAALRECTVTKTVRGREVPVGGDVVVGIESEPVDAHEQLMRHLVVECEPGETVPLTVIRDGAEETVTVELAERPPPGGGIPVR